MTETPFTYSPPDVSPSESWFSDQSRTADQSSTADVAKEQAAGVTQGVSSAAQNVASTAAEQVHNVAAEAGTQAKDLWAQTRSELSDQTVAQQQRAASGLHTLGDELRSMASGAQEPGMASDLARQASTHAHEIATWLESHEPRHLVEEVTRFARQRPIAFLGAALAVGLLAGRLTRGVKDATGGQENETSAQAYSPPGAPAPSVTQPAMTPPTRYAGTDFDPLSEPTVPTPPDPAYTTPAYTPGHGLGGVTP
jgi:hypothetical protein